MKRMMMMINNQVMMINPPPTPSLMIKKQRSLYKEWRRNNMTLGSFSLDFGV
jgi:hypothetical protein